MGFNRKQGGESSLKVVQFHRNWMTLLRSNKATLPQQDRQLLRTMGTEHEDALNVPGATGAGDESHEAGPSGTIPLMQQLVSSG
jgi:hypothetical protein